MPGNSLPQIAERSNLKTRDDFAKLINDRGFKIGIEVGVNRGEFSRTILSKSAIRKWYGLDPWGTRDRTAKRDAFKSLIQFGDRSELIVGTSPDYAVNFHDGYFDFVYIDGNHLLDPVRLDIAAWWPKVKSGGVLAGHDYRNRRNCQVIQAVNEFVDLYRLKLYITGEEWLPSWFVWKPKPTMFLSTSKGQIKTPKRHYL